MLQKNAVRKPLWDLLKYLQNSNVFENYFLAGGTALSLQLGHRISDDIDLFTKSDLNKDEIFDFLNKKYNKKYQINNIQNIVLQVTIDDIKVDFVKHDYNLVEDIKKEEGIRYLGKKDISAMKLMAVANRGDQAKDFIRKSGLIPRSSAPAQTMQRLQKFGSKPDGIINFLSNEPPFK